MIYDVSIREIGDTGAHWLYGIAAATPSDAVDRAQHEALRHGYGQHAIVRLWSPDGSGSTIGREPLHEETVDAFRH